MTDITPTKAPIDYEAMGPIVGEPHIDAALTNLLHHDLFYCYFIQQMRRIYDETLPAPAGVANSRGLEIRINPRMWERLNLAQQVVVLEHECKHVIADHLGRVRAMPEWESLFRFYNICTDLAVNSTIKDADTILPMGVHVTALQKQGYSSLKPAQPFEYYVAYFQQEQEKLIKMAKDAQGEGPGTDDHSQWGEGDGEPEEVKRMAVREALSRAADRAAGKVPGDVRELIESLNKRVNNWRKLLQAFPQEATSVDSESCRMRRNRRYGIYSPGSRRTFKTQIGVGVDTSGSIGDAMLGMFAAEINRIIEGGAEVTVYFFDTRVCQTLPKVDKMALGMYDKSGGGGTCFQPVLDAVGTDRLDGLIMLTDGFNGDQLFPPRFPVLWAIAGNPTYQAPFGKVIHVCEET